MASFTITTSDVFPDGTTVGAYPADNIPAGTVVPSGSPVATAVTAGGQAVFSGLANGTRYVAYANVAGENRVRRFLTPALSSAGSGGPSKLRQRGILHPATYPAMASPPVYTRSAANAVSAIASASACRPGDRGFFTFRGPPSALLLDANGYMRCNPTGQLNSTTPPWAIEFFSDAPQLEVNFGANLTPRYRLLVDLLDGRGFQVAGGPYADPGGTGTGYLDLFNWTTVGGRAWRHYRIECENTFRFGGLNVGPQDTVNRVEYEEPTIVMGDSFVEPTIQENVVTPFGGDGCASVFGRVLGLRNCFPCGWGGTGYLNPGSGRTKFRDHFLNDVVPQKPARLYFAGGINDANREPTYTAQMAHDEAVTLFQFAQQQLPSAEIGVFSPWVSQGFPTASLYAFSDAIRQAAADCGLPFYDLLGLIPQVSRVVGTLLAVTTTAAAIQCDTPMPLGSWVRVGGSSAASGWGATPNPVALARVTAVTGASSPYTINFATGMAAGIQPGQPVATTGRPWVTGNGKQTVQNNSGSADLLIGADATHPTVAGHIAAGRAMAQGELSTIGY